MAFCKHHHLPKYFIKNMGMKISGKEVQRQGMGGWKSFFEKPKEKKKNSFSHSS